MSNSFKRVLASFAVLLSGIMAFAQVTTSSMSGKVTDANGPVVGVVVTAVYEPTGSQFYAVTGNDGSYRINSITAGGPYKVSFTSLGYNDLSYTGVTAPLADNVVLNAVITEQSMALEGTTVVAERKITNMSSDRAGTMTVLSTKDIMNVPTTSRSLNALIKQTPQATVSGSNAYIGGGNHRDSYVTIDGAAFNNAFGIGSNLPAGGSPISMDALEQMSISVTPFDVRQSGFTGGGISATTKSGTNTVKGSVYGYYRNQDMRGYRVGVDDYRGRYIDKSLLESKTDSRYFMYGATVGGPIIKNKLFLFLNIEADRSISPGPTTLLANGTIDADGKIVPGDKVYESKNNVARPNAVVLDALSQYLNDKYEYNPGMVRGYNTETPSLKVLARLDWNINNNHKLNLRYSLTNSKYASSPSSSVGGLDHDPTSNSSRTSRYAAYFQNARYYQEQNFYSFAGELNSRFLDGSLNNVFRVAYSHQFEPRSVEGGYFPFVDIIVNGDNGKAYDYTSFGYEPFSYGNLRDVSTTTITDELTWNIGKHTILAGAQYELDLTKNGFQRFGAGYYEFDFDSEQALYDAIKAGTVFDNPVQFAITHGNNKTFTQEYPHFTFGQASAYIQDQINVSNNFKLTAGVRFEMPNYPSLEDNFNQRVADATFAPTLSNPEGKYDTRNLPRTRISVSPRIGFNWDLAGDRRYVLRGGTGIFVGRIPFVWIVAQSGDAGVLQTTYTTTQNIPTISSDRNAILNQLYPGGFTPEAAGLNISSISLMDPELRNPSSWKSSLAFDAVLPADIKASIEATYKKDINPVTVKNIGLNAPTTLSEAKFVAARPYYNNGYRDSQITNAYLIYNVTNPKLWGDYFSLTTSLEKNFPFGINARVAYTYANSRVLNNGVGDQVYSVWNGLTSVRGANNAELGYASFVNPHRIIGNINWHKDYAKYFGTSISLAYYGGISSRTHMTYNGNILGDGSSLSNLIDIPTYEDLYGNVDGNGAAYGNGNWTFEPSTYKEDGETKTYTAEMQARDLDNYINQNKYLKTHRGQVMDRYGMMGKWHNTVDLKIEQSFYFYTGANHKKHTIQVGADISNFGNLLNPYWGNGISTTGTGMLKLTNAKQVYTEGAQPKFQVQTNNGERYEHMYYTSISSGWSAILSVRYTF